MATSAGMLRANHDSAAHAPRAPLCARFDADAGRDVVLGTESRPEWRGRVHLIGLVIAVPWLAELIDRCDSTTARVGACIYATGLCTMLAVSVTYHRWVHGLRTRAVLRRADHATIFAAIAGSATPVALVVLPGARGVALVASLWIMSLVGASFKVSRLAGGDVVGTAFYAAVSVMATLALPALWQRAGVAPAVLFMVSGLLYTQGAVNFRRQWPKLRPAVFSYHEVWHVCTVLAAAAHFSVVWMIAT